MAPAPGPCNESSYCQGRVCVEEGNIRITGCVYASGFERIARKCCRRDQPPWGGYPPVFLANRERRFPKPSVHNALRRSADLPTFGWQIVKRMPAAGAATKREYVAKPCASREMNLDSVGILSMICVRSFAAADLALGLRLSQQ